MKNGQTVASFERAFAEYVNAKYAIALCNGTSTLHTALVALGVKPGDRVATTPLTMSATSIAILQAGAVPVYADVSPHTWLMGSWPERFHVGVSLFGLSNPKTCCIDDAAQTLRKHGTAHFTSYSFQASKILSLGEGGMLVTDSEELATKAREFSSLGYRMKADQPRIDPSVLKSPDYERHHSLGWNYRMNDVTATEGLKHMNWGCDDDLPHLLRERSHAASFYHRAIEGCSWIKEQFVPDGWEHDMWSYAIALESPKLWEPFASSIERHGGERPYAAWLPTYLEPGFKHLGKVGDCPVAESLQKRIVAFQTNSSESAEKNAKAVKKAIEEIEPLTHKMASDVERRLMGAVVEARRFFSGDATGTPCS